jgi:hypothetical protein
MWPSGLFRISCRQYASSADFSRSRSAGVFACFVAPFDIAHLADIVKDGILGAQQAPRVMAILDVRVRPGRQPACECRAAIVGLFLTGVVIYDNITRSD